MGKIPILTNIFQRGWNHQPDKALLRDYWLPWSLKMAVINTVDGSEIRRENHLGCKKPLLLMGSN